MNREKQFLIELSDLLERYDVEIEYSGEYGGDYELNFYSAPKFEEREQIDVTIFIRYIDKDVIDYYLKQQ